MINYQVDECLNSKKLVSACAAEGLVNVRRFPKRLKQSEDPVVLQDVLSTEWTLVTTDREIHFQHSVYIPNNHSGILIIASSQPSRTRLASAMSWLSFTTSKQRFLIGTPYRYAIRFWN